VTSKKLKLAGGGLLCLIVTITAYITAGPDIGVIIGCLLGIASLAYYNEIEKLQTRFDAQVAIGRVNEELQLSATECELTGSKLQNQSKLLTSIITAIPYRIAWKDIDGVYCGCNQSFALAAGVGDPQEIAGKTDYDLPWTKEQADLFVKRDREVIRTGIALVNMEEPVRLADGKTVEIVANSFPLRGSNGEVTGALGIYMNSSEQAGTNTTRPADLSLLNKKMADVGKPQERRIMTSQQDCITEKTKKQYHILIVDDVQENRMLADILLRKAGYITSQCSDGAQAVELAAKEKFDLIMMDVQMPVMDGLEATKLIRSDSLNSKTAILAMTALDLEEGSLQCFDAGCDDYLPKPIKKNLLLRKIKRFVEQDKQNITAANGDEITSFLTGDPDFQKTIETFINNLPGRIKAMQDALDDKNLAELADKAHALKGVGSFAGFPIYTERAKALETMIRDSQIEKIQEQIDELLKLCSLTKSAGT